MIKVMLINENAKMPSKVHNSDAGWDLYCAEDFILCSSEVKMCSLGIKVGLPKGYVGLLRGRSGLAGSGIDPYEFCDIDEHNEIKLLGGVVDSGYRGEWRVILKNLGAGNKVFAKGDKIAQVVIIPICQDEMIEVNKLDETDRGEKGFGSSDKKNDPFSYLKAKI